MLLFDQVELELSVFEQLKWELSCLHLSRSYCHFISLDESYHCLVSLVTSSYRFIGSSHQLRRSCRCLGRSCHLSCLM